MRGVTAAPALGSVAAMLLPDPVTRAPTGCDSRRAGVKLIPVSGLVTLTTGVPTAWTIVSGVVRVSPEPFAPAVPTLWMTFVSWLAPVSIWIVWPAAKPSTLARRSVLGPGGVWMFWFHGADPVGARDVCGRPRRVVEGDGVPAGRRRGRCPGESLPGCASVTILVEPSSATAITLPAPPPLTGAMAMTLVPDTSSDLMSLIWDVCQALFPRWSSTPGCR